MPLSPTHMSTLSASLRPGVVRLFPHPDGAGVRDAVALLGNDPTTPSVLYCWAPLPPLRELLENVRIGLAEAALRAWPNWPGAQVEATLSRDGIPLSHLPPFLPAWLDAARQAVLWERLPVVRRFPHQLQVRQLILALGGESLTLVLGVAEEAPPADRLLVLTKAAQWLGGMGCRIVVLLPQSLLARPELEAIAYQSLSALPIRPVAAEPVMNPPFPLTGEETKQPLVHIFGIPHPGSPGEQVLCARLGQDPELGGLFGCNQTVRTVRSGRYLVDLLWQTGRVVVEVDGYRGHTQLKQFILDRQRDYELVLSGYLVLRLTHDEVVSDPALAVEKIRDFVNLRSSENRG